MSLSGPSERVIQGAGSARPQCRHRALPMHLAFEPAGSPCPGSGFAEGRALHARKGRRRVELWHIPARSPAVPLPRMIMLCPGLRPACNPDAETAPLRENRLSRHFRAFPARRPALRWAWSRRGGLRTPVNEALLPPGDRAIRPPGVRLPR